jgi:hypothetical protein
MPGCLRRSPWLLLLLLLGAGCLRRAQDTRSGEDTHDSESEKHSSEPFDSDSKPYDSHTGGDSTLGDSTDSADSADSGDSGIERCDVAILDPYVEPEVWATPLVPVPGKPVVVHYRGALAGLDGVTIHYGFDGWTHLASVPTLVSDGSGLEASWYLDAPMTRSKDGSWQATVDTPSDGRSLHFTFVGIDGSIDDDDGQQYDQSLVFPFVGPFLTWNHEAQPSNGVVVNFETSIPCWGVVAFGPTPRLGLCATGSSMDRMHHVALTGLAPGTTWYYEVMDSAGNASGVQAFTIADDGPTSFSFVVLGDVQDDGTTADWSRAVDEVLLAAPNADFILGTGDFADWNEPRFWWIFFDRARDLLSTRVFLPTMGNHDFFNHEAVGSSTFFGRYFDLPYPGPDQYYYGLDYGRIRFLVLNSQDPTISYGSTEYVWTGDQVAACWDGDRRLYDRVFAFWHVPPYDAGSRHGMGVSRTRNLTWWLDGTVDWHFSGHEHLYQRTIPLQYSAVPAPSGLYGTGSDDGIGYSVAPSAGSDVEDELISTSADTLGFRALLAWPVLDASETEVDSELGFLTVEVDGTRYQIDAWGLGPPGEPEDAHVIDTVTVD